MFGYLWVFNDLRYAKTPFLGRFSTVIEPGWMVLRLRDSEARDLIEAAVGGALPDKAPDGCKSRPKRHLTSSRWRGARSITPIRASPHMTHRSRSPTHPAAANYSLFRARPGKEAWGQLSEEARARWRGARPPRPPTSPRGAAPGRPGRPPTTLPHYYPSTVYRVLKYRTRHSTFTIFRTTLSREPERLQEGGRTALHGR